MSKVKRTVVAGLIPLMAACHGSEESHLSSEPTIYNVVADQEKLATLAGNYGLKLENIEEYVAHWSYDSHLEDSQSPEMDFDKVISGLEIYKFRKWLEVTPIDSADDLLVAIKNKTAEIASSKEYIFDTLRSLTINESQDEAVAENLLSVLKTVEKHNVVTLEIYNDLMVKIIADHNENGITELGINPPDLSTYWHSSDAFLRLVSSESKYNKRPAGALSSMAEVIITNRREITAGTMATYLRHLRTIQKHVEEYMRSPSDVLELYQQIDNPYATIVDTVFKEAGKIRFEENKYIAEKPLLDRLDEMATLVRINAASNIDAMIEKSSEDYSYWLKHTN